MTRGSFWGKTLPTYVYPHCIKTVVREVIGGELGDYPDPQGPAVRIYNDFNDLLGLLQGFFVQN